MSLRHSLGILFLTWTAIYWYIQLGTVFFCKRYFLQVAFLVGGGVLGLWFVFSVITAASGCQAVWLALAIVALLLSLAALALGLIKLLLRQGDRPRSLHALSRALALYSSSPKRLVLRTEDGVKIQVLHLMGEPQRKDVIIVCHGGGRNKDIEANVTTCELLFEDYDVITFDFRGHQESGGKWAGDGSSKYDLKVVIDYAKQNGYEKVGIVSWSFGAWTAVMEVAEYKNADTVVAAAPPPTDMREIRMTKALFARGFRFWGLPVRIAMTVLRGMRIGRYDVHPSLMSVVDQVAPIPLLIVCNEYDDTIGVPKERFRELYDRAKEPKEFVVLKGTGHIYDWPNTFHYLALVREWLRKTMR